MALLRSSSLAAAVIALAATHAVAAERKAAQVGVTYTVDAVAVPAGLDPGVTALDNLDVTLRLRLKPLVGWPDAQLFFYGLGNQGGSPSARAGDLQGVSNIESPGGFKLYEAWLEQRVESASILVGLYDLNSEFDHLRSANLFLNGSQGVNAVLGLSGDSGPSIFPVTSLAARLKVLAGHGLYFQAALLDGVPGDPDHPHDTRISLSQRDGALVAFESGATLGLPGGAAVERDAERVRRRRAAREGIGLYTAKIAFGGFWYSARFDDLQSTPARPSSGRTNYGGYAIADALVLREPGTQSQGLAAHARVAWANPRFNVASLYTGGGLVYAGAVPSRDVDETGIAVSAAWSSPRLRDARRASGLDTSVAEVALEATHLFFVTSWLTLQLDAQYVLAPSFEPARDDAVVLIGRVQGAF